MAALPHDVRSDGGPGASTESLAELAGDPHHRRRLCPGSSDLDGPTDLRTCIRAGVHLRAHWSAVGVHNGPSAVQLFRGADLLPDADAALDAFQRHPYNPPAMSSPTISIDQQLQQLARRSERII